MTDLDFDPSVPLDPELQDCLCEAPSLGQCLKHPLVFGVPYWAGMNAQYNASLKAKRRMADEAYMNRESHRFVFLHERPYRLDALMELENNERLGLNKQEGAELIKEVWTDTENFWQHRHGWRELLTRYTIPMTDAEHTMHRALPKTVTVYRGVSGEHELHEPVGFSWTLHKRVAVWFARRFSKRPYLWTATVDRNTILFLCMARNEYEVVVLPEHTAQRSIKHIDPTYKKTRHKPE